MFVRMCPKAGVFGYPLSEGVACMPVAFPEAAM